MSSVLVDVHHLASQTSRMICSRVTTLPASRSSTHSRSNSLVVRSSSTSPCQDLGQKLCGCSGLSSDSCKTQVEEQLSGAVRNLLVSVEAYPELKSNVNFLELQRELTATELTFSPKGPGFALV